MKSKTLKLLEENIRLLYVHRVEKDLLRLNKHQLKEIKLIYLL